MEIFKIQNHAKGHSRDNFYFIYIYFLIVFSNFFLYLKLNLRSYSHYLLDFHISSLLLKVLAMLLVVREKRMINPFCILSSQSQSQSYRNKWRKTLIKLQARYTFL